MWPCPSGSGKGPAGFPEGKGQKSAQLSEGEGCLGSGDSPGRAAAQEQPLPSTTFEINLPQLFCCCKFYCHRAHGSDSREEGLIDSSGSTSGKVGTGPHPARGAGRASKDSLFCSGGGPILMAPKEARRASPCPGWGHGGESEPATEMGASVQQIQNGQLGLGKDSSEAR